jgi:hypothetical protein
MLLMSVVLESLRGIGVVLIEFLVRKKLFAQPFGEVIDSSRQT